MNNNIDINKAYVSPYDLFLREFNQKNPSSASQLKEIAKHQAIAKQRDDPNACDDQSDIWQAF